MNYYTAVSIVLLILAVYVTYRIRNRKRGKRSIAFQTKRLPADKRRRHILLNRDKGKVISFPGSSEPARQNRSGQDGPDSRQSKK